MFRDLDDIIMYLDLLNTTKVPYLICVAMQGNWIKHIDRRIDSCLKKLMNKDTNFDIDSDCSYCAIIYKEKYFEDKSDTEPAEIVESFEENNIITRVSVVSNYSVLKDTKVEPGIVIDGCRYGFFLRGISIVLYDTISSCLVDSVVFDTGRADFKTIHPFGKAAAISNMITELYGGFGYTIAQFLYDSGITTFSIYAEPGFDELVRTALLPLVLHRGLHIEMCFSICEFVMKFSYDGAFPRQKFVVFSLDKIPKDSPVIILTPFCSTCVKAALIDSGIAIYEISRLVSRAVNYIKNEQAVLKKISEVPGVIAVSYSKPRKETCYNTEEHKRLLKEGYSTDKIYDALKKGLGYPYVSKAIVEADHTVDEWAELMCKPIPEQYVDENGYIKFYDKSGKYVNIHNGHREVAYGPDSAENTIYIFGDCNTFGIYNSDSETYSSQLQRMLNDAGYSYTVKNYGWFLFNYRIKQASIIAQIVPHSGDIMVFEGEPSGVFEHPHLSLKNEIVPADRGEMFYDGAHYTPNMHYWLAEKFFDFLTKNSFFKNFPKKMEYRTMHIPISGFYERKTCAFGGGYITDAESSFREELENFKRSLQEYRMLVGAIVMNCNPFTNGHRYLIETAASQVERLFVFVVEEDKSYFPFKERYELVRKGSADLTNVIVLPSGNFMISRLTFSEYFNKSQLQDRVVDPSKDIEIFCKYIAPFMGINIRFAGEEPLDHVTRQYNEMMRKVLPAYGIEFREIPRVEVDGEVVSASRVRKILKDKEWEALAGLVPETTLEMLKGKYA